MAGVEGSAVDDALDAPKDTSDVDSDRFPHDFKEELAADPDATDDVLFGTAFILDHHLDVFSSFSAALAFRLSRALS